MAKLSHLFPTVAGVVAAVSAVKRWSGSIPVRAELRPPPRPTELLCCAPQSSSLESTGGGGPRKKKKKKKKATTKTRFVFSFSSFASFGPLSAKMLGPAPILASTLASNKHKSQTGVWLPPFFFPLLSPLSTKEKMLHAGIELTTQLQAAPRLFSSRKKWIRTPHCSRVVLTPVLMSGAQTV